MVGQRLVLTLIAAGAFGSAPASSAVASDATLKREIRSNLVKNRPALTTFQDAVDGFTEADAAKRRAAAARLGNATDRLRPRISSYKRGVARNSTSSRNGSIAKRTLLSGLREFDTGLREYKRAADKVRAGASRSSVLPSLRRADRRFLLAAKREEAAITRLNIERPD
ncbi:MAG: hypothetical protein M3417_11425 [Actinomycetota bacterium]|nr:hypothetical protein [Actinomycetota bacterium]